MRNDSPNVKALVADFIANAAGFFEDSNMADIDVKHADIIDAAYQQVNDSQRLGTFSFRSWKEQGDLSVPAQLSLQHLKSSDVMHYVLRYGFRKLFRRTDDRALLDALLDDVAIVKGIGGSDLLRENPAHDTPGAKEYYFLSETSISTRWLRYLYLLQRIRNEAMLPEDGVWVDIGSYYGGMQGLVRKYYPKSKMVLVDFHHQLCRSYVYLKHLYPDAVHILPDQVSQYPSLSDLPEGSIVYQPALSFDALAGQSFDLVTNFFSFGEMRKSVFDSYFKSSAFRQSSVVFTVNRFVSAPHFEATYDTDLTVLDYQDSSRSLRYFDVFPMHHYMLTRRDVYGRKRLRNTSSSYFEMVSIPATSSNGKTR